MSKNEALEHFSKKYPGIYKKLEEFKEHEKNELWPLPEDGKVGIFIIKRASEWLKQASQKPVPTMLFDKFWHQGELCILFADTNTGKSILAVQIADSISRGVPIDGFGLEHDEQEVVYLDFELSEKQFENRYSKDYKDHYVFDDNFIRGEINAGDPIPEQYDNFEDFLMASLGDTLHTARSYVLIIDNITYLRNETERAKDALPLMKQLMKLKRKFDVSILVLAHTPKRDMSKPITRNDLQGSKMLINFCDSSFCIGESMQDKGVRYLKQIKARNTEIVYDQKNVVTCRIEKPDNFLRFTHTGYAEEYQHLKSSEDKDKAFLVQRVKELVDDGMSYQQIADELGIGKSTVGKYANL